MKIFDYKIRIRNKVKCKLISCRLTTTEGFGLHYMVIDEDGNSLGRWCKTRKEAWKQSYQNIIRLKKIQ